MPMRSITRPLPADTRSLYPRPGRSSRFHLQKYCLRRALLRLPTAGGQIPGEQLFIYPRQGQNEKKQADDRYECHRWAVNQTNFDPTKPPESMPESQKLQKHADYKRAMGACLEGRGYIGEINRNPPDTHRVTNREGDNAFMPCF